MINIAKDRNGNLVPTTDASTGVDYYCFTCDARMRFRKCTNRCDHFYLFNDRHKSAACAELDRDLYTIRDINLLEPSRLMRQLLRPRAPSTGKGTQHRDPSPKIDRILAPSSLKQLIACGVAKFSPDTPIEGGILTDVFIPISCYSDYLPKCNSSSLGFRILILRPDHISEDRLVFVAFWKGARMFFRLKFKDSEMFRHYAEALFITQEGKYGTLYGTRARVPQVWVAGVWEHVSQDLCGKFCIRCAGAKTPCMGMQETVFSSKAQLYIPD